jgi:AcrR family transcriptional regulator
LRVAADLFLVHGVEGTTLAMVAKESQTVIGTVRHFFGTKSQLAGSVYDDLADRLATDAKAALGNHGDDVSAAVRALLSACLKWPVKFAHYRKLIGMLEAYPSTKAHIRTDRLPARLGKVLAEWMETLEPNRIRGLSPTQLYAVLLAPALCDSRLAAEPVRNGDEGSISWFDVLTIAALAAITPTHGHGDDMKKRSTGKGRRRVPPPGSEGAQGILI